MDSKKLQLEFVEWCKAKNKSPKSKEETTLLFHAFMKEKYPKEYEAAMKQQSQEQVKTAAHGAKLNYFKNLKNQCAEDEEVVYYKKGGSVTCGCKKKEQGGEVPTAKCGSAIENFKKARKAESGSKMLDLVNSRKGRQQAQAEAKKKREAEAKKKGTWAETTKVIGKDYQRGQKDAGPSSKIQDNAVEKEDIPSHDKNKIKERSRYQLSVAMKCGSKIKEKKCGGAVEKFKAAKCGSKLKKHLLGGSLNRIPFMLKGTPKEGIKMTENDLKDLQFYLWLRMLYPDGRRKSSIEKFLNYNLGIPERKTYPWFKESEINFLEPVKHNPYEQMLYNTKLLLKVYNKGINLFKQANNFNTTSGMGYIYLK